MDFKRRVADLLTLLVTFGLCFFALEVGLRMCGSSNPVLLQYEAERGVSFLPGARGTFEKEGSSSVRINEAGLRGEEAPLAKPPGEFRVALIGDSFVAALQVEEDRSFTRLLEKEIPACAPGLGVPRTLNFGVPGYGTVQEYLTIKKALEYKPDLIVFVFYPGNDLINNSPELSPQEIRPFFRPETGDFDFSFRQRKDFQVFSSPSYRSLANLARYSYIVRHFLKTLYRFVSEEKPASSQETAANCQSGNGATSMLSNNRFPVYRAPRDEAWRKAWQVTETLIARAARATGAGGAQFLLVSLSSSVQVHPDRQGRQCVTRELGVDDLSYPGQRLLAFSRSQGIDAIDVVPTLLPLAEANGTFFHGFDNKVGFGHYNEKGHAAVATIIARHICARAGQ